MAGAFQTISGNAHFLEFNVVNDIAAAQKVAREWPTPIVWSGFEIGIAFQLFDIPRLLAYSLSFVAVVLTIETVLVQPFEIRISRWRPRAA